MNEQVDRKAEEDARTSRESLSQILHGISIPLFVIDCRHVVVHWNQACEDLTRVPAEKMIGTTKPWSAFYAAQRPVLADLVVDQRAHEEISALYGAANCRESVARPGDYELEAFFSHFGDGGKWLFCTAAPLRDMTQQIVGAIETFQDITERKRTEEELQKLASVVRRTGELINLATPDGKMIFLNEAGSKMLGVDPEDVEQTQIMQVIPGALQEKVRTELLPALLRQGAWEGDLQYRNLKTGALTDVHAMAFTITDPDTGTPLYLANVSLDITERKRVESELQRRIEELSEAKRRMEVLVSNTTDREKRMVELKREVNQLSQMLGRAPKYQVPRKADELAGTCSASAAG
jgi:PAS domain S-box-containing protein